MPDSLSGCAAYGNFRPTHYRKEALIDPVSAMAELLAKARQVEELATERAIERVALSKEALARELVPSAVSNIADYVRINDDGDPVIDFSKATRQQLSAIKSLQVETYVAGRGDNAREVKRVKFQLHEKVPAAMGIARLFGWVVEKRDDEVRRIADRPKTVDASTLRPGA